MRAVLAAVLLAWLSISLCGCSDSTIEKLFRSEGILYTESESEGSYAYETLNKEEKLVYDQIVYAIEERKKDTRLATDDLDVMKKAYQAVRYDHCEYFWLEKFSYVTYNSGDKIRAIDFEPVFSMKKKQQEKIQAKIDSAVSKLLKNAPRDGSDYEKVLYVYEKIIRTVDYDTEAENSQNIISTFLEKKTVCQGYAYGAQYLLHELGIECTTVEGTTEGENHAWNLVRMDGEYYYIDTTWGNSQYVSYLNGTDEESGKYIDYNFMGMTTEEINETHTASEEIELPVCTATEDNYFVHEGLYFDEWNTAKIGHALSDAYESDQGQVQLKFADMDLFERAIEYFIEDYHISDYCRNLSKIRYIEIPDHNTLYVSFSDA